MSGAAEPPRLPRLRIWRCGVKGKARHLSVCNAQAEFLGLSWDEEGC
jgi:hypothetical protein